jgi:hypothetical protein
MKKFWRRFFRILFVLIILGVILAFASTFVFQRQIGNRLIGEVNERIASELSVDDIGLNIWANFPRAQAYMNGLTLTDTEGQTLMQAQKATLDLKLTSLFSTNYIVYTLNIDNGEVFLNISPEGKTNYNIFHAPGDSIADTPPSQSTNVSIDKAILSNMQLHYDNQQQRHKGEFFIENMEIEGEFSSRRFEMKNTGQIKANYYDTDQLRFFENKNIEYSTFIDVDLNAQSYELDQAKITIDTHPFRLQGDIEKWEKGYYMDLFISSEDSQLEGPVQLLPTAYEKILGDFESEGSTHFTAVVKGLWGESQNPELKAELKLVNGTLQHPKLDKAMDSTYFDVIFNNGDLKTFETAMFEIRDFRGRLGDEEVTAHLIINNFDNPHIDLAFDGRLPLQIFEPLLNGKDLQNLQGELAIRDFKLNGRYENMISPGYIGLVKTEGRLECQNVQATIKGDTARIMAGVFNISDNKLDITQFKVQGFDSDLDIQGTAFNVLPLLMADSVNSEDVELEFNANVRSSNLDVDKMLVTLDLLQDSTGRNLSQRQLIEKRERISQYLKGNLTTEIESFKYGDFSGQNFTGSINFANTELLIKGATEAMDGQVGIDAQLLMEYRPRLETQLTFEAVSSTQLFQQSKQFKQDFLTDQNLSGTMNGQVLLEASWDQNGRFMNEKMKAIGNLQFTNGTLKNLAPQKEYARFIKKPQLDSIAFSELKTYLEVRRRKVYIPMALITSDSFRLSLSGEHRFNDNFRYHLKLNANTALARSIQDLNKNIEPSAANQTGFYNFYHTIYGHRNSVDIRQAPAQVRSEFERSQIRRSEIHKKLLQVFDGISLIKEPKAWLDEEVIQ